MTRLFIFVKTLVSAMLLGCAGWFLWTMGPHPVAVHANIYAPLAASAGLLPPPPGEGQQLRHGRLTVNGAVFNYVVGSSRLSLGAVLSHYEQQFAQAAAGGPTLFSGARVDGDGAGVVAGIKFGAVMHPGDFGRRIGTFAETGRLGEFGEFHIISAFEQRGTVFIDFTPGRDVTLDRLLPREGADAPGADLNGVTRPSSLQRLFTITTGDDDTHSRVWIYRSADSHQAASAFHRAFRAAGWEAGPDLRTSGLAHYTNGEGDAFVGASGFGSNSVVIVVHRMRAHPKRGL